MVNKELLNEIEEYCKLNEEDVEETLNKAIRSGFTIIKYGETPFGVSGGKTQVEIKEVPIEKIVEKVVEKVVEIPVEVIKEVPVEKIVEVVREVPVDKIVEVEKSININVDGHDVNYIEYIEQLNTEISRLKVEKAEKIKQLTDANNKTEEINKLVVSAEAQIEKLRGQLKACKDDKGGYDLYGEK